MNLTTKQKLAMPFFLLLLLFVVTTSKAATINRPLADTTRVFSQVETQPQYQGGLQAFGAFLGQNIHYPAEDAKNKIQGRVYCTFVIEKDGTVSNVKAIRSPTEAMAAEAVRVLSIMPPWKPGLNGGKPVRVAYTVPVNFSLSK